MALVCLCRGNFYWPPHTTILFCSIFLDKIVLDTLKSRYHRSAPLGMASMIEQKGRVYGDDLTKVAWQEQEKDLLMITRALAGAVKSVIDIPLLDKDGKLMDGLDDKYNKMRDEAPKLQLAANQIVGYI